MLVHEVLSLFDGVQEIIDITPQAANVRKHLRIPEDLGYQALGLTDAEELAPGPGYLLIGLAGPHATAHTDPDALAPVLRRLRPGARALLLLAWPIDNLPYHRLIGPLVDGSCQVTEAIPLDRVAGHGAHGALVVSCVDNVAAPRAYLMDIRPEQLGPADPGSGAVERRVTLRLANEYVLADFVARPMRRRLTELEQRLNDMDRVLAERDAAEQEAARQLARARARVAQLEGSVSFQVGRVLVNGVRHPGRALVNAPRDLARVWRTGRSRRHQSAAATPAELAQRPDRVVPVALPVIGPAGTGRELIIMTAPPRMLVPRRLANAGLREYEPEALACFLTAIEVAGPGAVLDIGANVGIYAALASALTPRAVVAFEPTPELVELARRLAVDNGLGYTVEPLALGPENGTAAFHLSESSDTSSSLAKGFRESSEQIEVTVETLDSYVGRTGLVPAVMKLDTETTEPDVLRGAAKTIAEHRPWILCEVLARRAVERRLTEVLTPFGYTWHHITGEPPYPVMDQIVGDRAYKSMMWLFAPDKPTDAFWVTLRRIRAAIAQCTVERGRDLADRQARLASPDGQRDDLTA